MLAAIFLASQWHFLANKYAVLAGYSAFWPVNCIFLHKKTRTRCTAEWPFCYWSLFCGTRWTPKMTMHAFTLELFAALKKFYTLKMFDKIKCILLTYKTAILVPCSEIYKEEYCFQCLTFFGLSCSWLAGIRRATEFNVGATCVLKTVSELARTCNVWNARGTN